MRQPLIMLVATGFLSFMIIFSTMTSSCSSDASWKQKLAEKRYSDSYYSKYQILLKGVVIKKVPISKKIPERNYCTYTIRILGCNVKEHDVREMEDYYLLIKNDTARMVDHFTVAEVNDTTIIDYSRQKLFVWGKSKPMSLFGHSLPLVSNGYHARRKMGGLGW
jgi:hypothetical protein